MNSDPGREIHSDKDRSDGVIEMCGKGTGR